jgi:CBS-domain-containing membrane protein
MQRPTLVAIVSGALGGAVAIALMEVIANDAAFPLMIVPFATSIVLVMGSPGAEPAQPRALVGGHVISTLVGLVVVKAIGPGPWIAALAVGLAIAAMHLTRTFHPPAGIDPLIVVTNNLPWTFLAAPVAIGACLLAAFAFTWHKVVQHDAWPTRWW